MTPFSIDPNWYEHYWLREHPTPPRQALLRGLVKAARRAAHVIRPARPPTGATLRPI